jgi:Fic family protein
MTATAAQAHKQHQMKGRYTLWKASGAQHTKPVLLHCPNAELYKQTGRANKRSNGGSNEQGFKGSAVQQQVHVMLPSTAAAWRAATT